MYTKLGKCYLNGAITDNNKYLKKNSTIYNTNTNTTSTYSTKSNYSTSLYEIQPIIQDEKILIYKK